MRAETVSGNGDERVDGDVAGRNNVVPVLTPTHHHQAAECRLLRADREALLAELLHYRRRGCLVSTPKLCGSP